MAELQFSVLLLYRFRSSEYVGYISTHTLMFLLILLLIVHNVLELVRRSNT